MRRRFSTPVYGVTNDVIQTLNNKTLRLEKILENVANNLALSTTSVCKHDENNYEFLSFFKKILQSSLHLVTEIPLVLMYMINTNHLPFLGRR